MKHKKRPYAVNRIKFYATGDVEELHTAATSFANFNSREAVFAAHREALQEVLRSVKTAVAPSPLRSVKTAVAAPSSPLLDLVPGGFWADIRHGQHQFEWLTGLSIVNSIREEAQTQFVFLRAVLQVDGFDYPLPGC